MTSRSHVAWLRGSRSLLVVLTVAAGMFAYLHLTTAGFSTGPNIENLLLQAEILAFIAAGQTIVVIGAGIDLSVAAMMTGAGLFVTKMTEGRNDELPLALFVVLVVAVAVGVINGLGIAVLRISPIIMTLATSIGLAGATVLYSGTVPPQTAPTFVQSLARGHVVGIPAPLLGLALVAILLLILLAFSGYGRRLYAVGTNEVVARYSGVNVRRVIVMSYVLSAVWAAAAGILLLGYIGNAYLGSGDLYLFASIAAVTIGGASILGGSGNYFGTLGGVALLVMLNTLILSKNLGAGAASLLYGIVILLSAAISSGQVRVRFQGLSRSRESVPTRATEG